MWLDDDQDKVTAWLLQERRTCNRCGSTEEDWIDPVTKRLLDAPQWQPEVLRCHGCAALEAKREEIPERERGTRVVLMPYRLPEEDDE